jgi:hypothetical protein
MKANSNPWPSGEFMKTPESPIVRFALGWLAVGVAIAILTQFGGHFLVNMVLTYLFGAMASGAGIIQLAAVIAAGLFAAAMLLERFQSRTLAQWSLGVFIVLSLVTIWFDSVITAAFSPFFSSTTVELFAETAVSSFADRMLAIPLDLGATAVWIFLGILIAREADAELDGSLTERGLAAENEKLIQESLLPPISAEPILKAVEAVETTCHACQHVLMSTNRFCTRCGAPLKRASANTGEVS